MTQYLANIITEKELNCIQPGQFNVIKAPCGSGKTTFMFDDRILNFARDKKHVLYLIQNKITRDFIAHTHADKAIVFTDKDASKGWFDARQEHRWNLEEDENYVHVMCYQTFAALLRNEGTDWLNDIDLIVWDEFDDFKPYYEKELKVMKKMLPNFSKEKLIALLQEGKTTSVVNFIYQLKTVVLDEKRIRLIAVSATPEFAAGYFSEYLNYILTGKIECINDAKATIFIHSIINSINNKEFIPCSGRRYWCYTKYIHEALAIESAAKANGFHTISLWSESNPDHREEYTEEKARVTAVIRDEHMVPQPYNFVVTTGALGRGIDVFDTSVQDWICNSYDYEDIVQSNRARFAPERRYLLDGTQGWVEFVQNGFSSEYYQWHNVNEFKQLLMDKPIFSPTDQPQQLTSAIAVKKAYPDLFESRRYGKTQTTQYRIKPAV